MFAAWDAYLLFIADVSQCTRTYEMHLLTIKKSVTYICLFTRNGKGARVVVVVVVVVVGLGWGGGGGDGGGGVFRPFESVEFHAFSGWNPTSTPLNLGYAPDMPLLWFFFGFGCVAG